MAQAEIVGLVLTAALLGAVVGVGLAIALLRRGSSASALRAKQVEAYADWLAARLILPRVSLAYVEALRALKGSVKDAGAVTLRRDEAHRARTAFHEATVRLDRAVAGLVVWSDADDVFDRVRELDRLSSQGLRAAIDGDERAMDVLTQRTDESDRAAVALVRRSTGKLRAPHNAAWSGLARLMHVFGSIADQWAK